MMKDMKSNIIKLATIFSLLAFSITFLMALGDAYGASEVVLGALGFTFLAYYFYFNEKVK